MSLLERMMRDDRFNRFYLVGGTSLALQIGHRISVDIDLFVPEDFDVDLIAETLHRQYAAQSLEKEKNTVRAVIHDVKVDLIAHKYPLTCGNRLGGIG